ncbi:type VI secretion system baseplate subunit TssE [Pseudomonas sp. GD03944]|uniref:type VI secretion system baseplate subunit TssE n=1 Tax=Pseudomonas sp. GD03944 TaxID=2975409 RepID=UPI00244CCAA1|nr:type VI secretion system baseplate subunit TssE [Pseudomonas sp. GD03944]MDH1263701.1 type VI secretion system baseplate subunit TssE [Pseudomonas sp. GD03944]
MRLVDPGFQPPLFERLAAGEETVFDQDALADSVRIELLRLLNTRRAPRPPGTALTILDYGIGDWTALQAQRLDDRRLLTRDIRNAIQHFEPRLQLSDVDVQVAPDQQRLRIHLNGALRSGTRHWPVTFILEDLADTWEVRHERLDR